MALFWSKKPKAEKNFEGQASKPKSSTPKGVRGAKTPKAPKLPETTVVPPKAVIPSGRFDAATSVIVRPHITEKSGLLSQGGVYTFVVSADANKPSIAKAVKHLYKVTATKVAIVNLPAKEVWARGKWGTVSAVRKAVVTVKKGDTIDFV
ncbi:MAG TPA: 50S ribosomal protein L23 [Candidatus Paceibacterota bacterium]